MDNSSEEPPIEESLPAEFLDYSNPRRFFLLAVGFTWLFWVSIAVLDLEPFSMPGIVLFALGGIGPAVSGLVLIYTTASEEHVRDYWRRVVDVRRIDLRWYGVIVLLFPFVNGTALLIDAALDGDPAGVELGPQLSGDPLSILAFAGLILVFGPIPEELGWRGYALDGLQARWSALAASLVLGTVWAVWHLPLFAIDGTFQSQLGVLTPAFWMFTFGLVVQSVFYTWIYNNTGRSTLSAILFHFVTNFSGEVMVLDAGARRYQFVILAIVAAAVVVFWGPSTLMRETP